MKKQNVLGLMLATSVAVTSLAGCMVPGMTAKNTTGTQTGVQQPSTVKPGQPATGGQQATNGGNTATGGNTSAAAPAPAEAREGTAESLSDEKDMEAYDVMAGEADAGRTVLMVGAEKPAEGMVGITAATDLRAGKGDGTAIAIRGEAKASFRGKLAEEVRTKLKEREGKKAEKLKDRLEKLKGDRAKLHEKAKGGKWVDNGDGTETKSFDFSVEKTVSANGKTASFGRSVTMKRVRNIETKDLVSSHIEFSQSLPGGLTRKSTRSKVLNQDGTYTVTFNSLLTLPNGGTRAADWTKTIAVDGTVTGSGTIVWTDKAGTVKKTVTVTLNGTEEDTGATAGGSTVDGDAPEAAEGTQAESTATAAADSEATEAEEATDSDDDATDSDDATEEADASDDDEATEEDDASDA